MSHFILKLLLSLKNNFPALASGVVERKIDNIFMVFMFVIVVAEFVFLFGNVVSNNLSCYLSPFKVSPIVALISTVTIFS